MVSGTRKTWALERPECGGAAGHCRGPSSAPTLLVAGFHCLAQVAYCLHPWFFLFRSIPTPRIRVVLIVCCSISKGRASIWWQSALQRNKTATSFGHGPTLSSRPVPSAPAFSAVVHSLPRIPSYSLAQNRGPLRKHVWPFT